MSNTFQNSLLVLIVRRLLIIVTANHDEDVARFTKINRIPNHETQIVVLLLPLIHGSCDFEVISVHLNKLKSKSKCLFDHKYIGLGIFSGLGYQGEDNNTIYRVNNKNDTFINDFVKNRSTFY